MPPQHIGIEMIDGVGRIRLARQEKLNALSEAMRDEIEGALTDLGSDREAMVIEITGGPKVFSAGFDLDEVAASGFATFGHRVEEWNRALYDCPKPIVVGVAGPALAAGFDLALSGDLIIAADSAVFGHPEVQFGAVPSVALLEPRVGSARARELCMTGRRVQAEEALALGLVDRVVPVAHLEEELRTTTQNLARRTTATLHGLRRAGWQHLDIVGRLLAEYRLTARAVEDPENVARLRSYLDGLRKRDA